MLVVGAGPAGAELTRLLARNGVDVLLVDRLADLSRAAFSSAAMPLSALDAFGLPASVVAARWSGWELLGPGSRRRLWTSQAPQGVVLDFAALRRWLVQEALAWGARVWLGQRLIAAEPIPGGLRCQLQADDGSRQEIRADWLIDATGQERALLGDPPLGPTATRGLISGVGVEWLVEVPRSCWLRWSDRLAFALGSDWVAQGYGWVFPMQAGQLKIGVCRLIDDATPQEPLGGVLQRLIGRLLDPGERQAMRVLDRHGGLIRSTIDRREPHRRGRLLGVGDAVSTANLLGGEGIRHALTSSRVLAPLLLEALSHDSPPLAAPMSGLSPVEASAGHHRPRCEDLSDAAERCLDRYPGALRRGLGWRWSLSGRLARRTWLGLRDTSADRRLDRLLRSLEGRKSEVLGELLFGYHFERYGLRALPYLIGWR